MDVTKLSAKKLEAEGEKTDKAFWKVVDELIAAGRGLDKPSDIFPRTDPLSVMVADSSNFPPASVRTCCKINESFDKRRTAALANGLCSAVSVTTPRRITVCPKENKAKIYFLSVFVLSEKNFCQGEVNYIE